MSHCEVHGHHAEDKSTEALNDPACSLYFISEQNVVISPPVAFRSVKAVCYLRLHSTLTSFGRYIALLTITAVHEVVSYVSAQGDCSVSFCVCILASRKTRSHRNRWLKSVAHRIVHLSFDQHIFSSNAVGQPAVRSEILVSYEVVANVASSHEPLLGFKPEGGQGLHTRLKR